MFVSAFGKVTEVNLLPLKALVPIVVTEFGIEIDVSPLFLNAPLPIDVRPVPKLTVDRVVLKAKAFLPITCSESGKVSEVMELKRNASAPIRSTDDPSRNEDIRLNAKAAAEILVTESGIHREVIWLA
jgi:hypothetical protein